MVTPKSLPSTSGARRSPPSARVAAAAAAKASAALQAKLADHPMSCLAHYNQAMELTRHIQRIVAYPSPLLRGRSAYKLPGGEPEDAPPYWREHLGCAVAAAAAEGDGCGGGVSGALAGRTGSGSGSMCSGVSGGGGALHLDAAYLRRGCVLVVLEYSARRGRRHASGAAVQQGTHGGGGAAVWVGDRDAALPNSTGESGGAPAQRTRALTPPALSREQLTAAFGPGLVCPGVEIQAQHFAGPTGGDILVSAAASCGELPSGPSPLVTVARASSCAAVQAARQQVAQPCLELLDAPCLLTSTDARRLRVIATLAAPRGAAGPAPAPRVVVRYGGPDCVPQPCPVVLEQRPEGAASTAAGIGAGSGGAWRHDDGSDDDLRSDVRCRQEAAPAGGLGAADWAHSQQVVPAPAAEEGAVASCAAAAAWPSAASAAGSSSENSSGSSNNGRGRQEAVEQPCHGTYEHRLRVTVGSCPRPGLLLLELDLGARSSHVVTAAASADVAAIGQPPGVQLPAMDAAQQGCSGGTPARGPLLSEPLPVVVVDDPAAQRELNDLAAAVTAAASSGASGSGGSGVNASSGGGAGLASDSASATPQPQSQRLPGWFRGFLYDMGSYLCLQVMEEEALLERHRAAAAALAAGSRRRRATGSAVSGTRADGHAREYASDGEEEDYEFYEGEGDEEFLSWPPPTDSGGTLPSGQSACVNGGGGAAADGHGEPHAAAAEQLLVLAAGLASYACRQGLPATLSYVLAGVRRCGVPLLRLNDEVRAQCGGLGLGHLAVQSADADVLHSLLLQARPPHAPSAAAAAYDGTLTGGFSVGSVLGGTEADGGGGRAFRRCRGSRLAALSDCTALFVAAAPLGGITPLHMAACAHPSRGPEVAQLLLSLCPLAAHAWFEVRDAAGNSAAQYALRAGNAELNEQCMEQLVLESLEAAVLGGGDADDVTAAAMATAKGLAAQGRAQARLAGHGSAEGVRVDKARDEEEQEEQEGEKAKGGLERKHGEAFLVEQPPAGGVFTVSLLGEADPRVADGSVAANGRAGNHNSSTAVRLFNSDTAPCTDGNASPSVRVSCSTSGAAPAAATAPPCPTFATQHASLGSHHRWRRFTLVLSRLPWGAPLAGFSDPRLEAAFHERSGQLALQRNAITLGFYALFFASCFCKALLGAPQQPPCRGAGAFLLAVGPGVGGLVGPLAVAAGRLQGRAHDGALALGDLLRGLVVGGVHVAGLPHPQAFEVADVGVQESLTTLFDCLILPAMVQMGCPVISLANALTLALIELPMALRHGVTGWACAWLLMGRLAAALAVRYALALWARTSYLRGLGSGQGLGDGGGASGSRGRGVGMGALERQVEDVDLVPRKLKLA